MEADKVAGPDGSELSEGLGPLPEADGTAEANKERHPEGGYTFDEIPAWSESLVRAYAAEQVVAERERWKNVAMSKPVVPAAWRAPNCGHGPDDYAYYDADDKPECRDTAEPLYDQATLDAATALPHPGSPEASAMIDSLLAEYNWPANPKNAARAGYEAARRMLAPNAELTGRHASGGPVE